MASSPRETPPRTKAFSPGPPTAPARGVRMIGLDGKGTWGALSSRLYDTLVARGQEALYDELLAEFWRAEGAPSRAATTELLDVGCGPGHAALRLLRAAPSARVVGLDSSVEMVRMAQSRAARAGLSGRARFVTGDALSLPFPDASFDGAVSLASIKHWPDRPRGLAELHRVLRPGAALLVVEADRAASDGDLDRYARRWPWLPPALLRIAFRGFIARGSIDEREARVLLDGSPFRGSGTLRSLDGTPLLALVARRR